MNKLLAILVLGICTNVFSQTVENKIEEQIKELHLNTKKVKDSINLFIKESNLALEKTRDSVEIKKIDSRLTQLWSVFDATLRKEVKNDLDFALKHPDSPECIQLLLKTIQKQEGLDFYDEYKKAYENFSEEIKSSDAGLNMKEKLKYFEQSKVGSIAPNFNVKDINGTQLTLSDFRDKKYILLEFWASWCAPCISDQVYLKKIYKKYSPHDFEIISISQDTDIEKWKTSITKHKTNIWKHVCVVSENSYCGIPIIVKPSAKKEGDKSKNTYTVYNLVKNEKSIQSNYFVSGIPHYVLIDKKGNIVGKWKNSGEINMIELENKVAEVIQL